MDLDTILWLSASVAQAAVVVLLFYRRVRLNFPIFTAYSVWTLAAGVGFFAISRNSWTSGYLTAYLADLIVDSILLFSVLVELAWSLLRPIRASLSKKVLWVIGAVIFILGAAIWPFSVIPGATNLSGELVFLLRLQQTVSILEVVVFLTFVASTQVLSIGWRDRELQIATGLGFASLVDLAVTVLHAQPAFRLQYNLLNQFGIGAYVCSLLYWTVSFAQQEEQRREFTPQMQSMLLAVAGAARATRMALSDSETGSQRKNDRP